MTTRAQQADTAQQYLYEFTNSPSQTEKYINLIETVFLTLSALAFVLLDINEATYKLCVAFGGFIVLRTLIHTQFLSAFRNAASNGYSIQTKKTLEIAHKLKRILFTNTAILTYGTPKVLQFELFESSQYSKEECLYFLCSAQSLSTHPLAQAMLTYFYDSPNSSRQSALATPHEFRVLAAENGIAATVDERRVHIANYAYFFGEHTDSDQPRNFQIPCKQDVMKRIVEEKKESGNVVLWFSIDYTVSGYLCLYDAPRVDAKHVIHELNTVHNTRCLMLTKNRMNTAKYIADAVGISAEDIVEQVEQVKGQRFMQGSNAVAMSGVVAVGTSDYDMDALMRSDVAFVMGNQTGTVRGFADIVILNSSLNAILHVMEAAHSIRKCMYTGLFCVALFVLVLVVFVYYY